MRPRILRYKALLDVTFIKYNDAFCQLLNLVCWNFTQTYPGIFYKCAAGKDLQFRWLTL